MFLGSLRAGRSHPFYDKHNQDHLKNEKTGAEAYECKYQQWGTGAWRFEINGRGEIKSVKIKIKIKIKGSGRGRPLYTGLYQQGARGTGRNDVYGEGGAEGICHG